MPRTRHCPAYNHPFGVRALPCRESTALYRTLKYCLHLIAMRCAHRKQQRQASRPPHYRKIKHTLTTLSAIVASLPLMSQPATAACTINISITQPLVFGEFISPNHQPGNGWVSITPDGSYSISSHHLSAIAGSDQSATAQPGKLTVTVTAPGHATHIDVRLTPESPLVELNPAGTIRLPIPSGQPRTLFEIPFGGTMSLTESSAGEVNSDVTVFATCKNAPPPRPTLPWSYKAAPIF